jgi:autotransporter-associated beta strand protein
MTIVRLWRWKCLAMPPAIVTNAVILRALGGNMRELKKTQRHSLPFGLFLAVAGALLLPVAVAPRANAEVDANFSWTGVFNTDWNNSANWSPGGGPPQSLDTALFNGAFINQPNLPIGNSLGTLWMTDGVAQNVTLSSTGGASLNISGLGILGTGILVDNASAFTLTITADLSVGQNQAWTNNSGNLFSVSGNVTLNGNGLTVNGTGDTRISGGVISDSIGTGSLTKDGSGTLRLGALSTYDGGTTVNGGTLLVNNGAGSGTGGGSVTVNNAGTTLGGTGVMNGAVTVNAGANLAPGDGGNNTAILHTGALTLASTSNFRVDINGTTQGTQYDRIQVNGLIAAVTIAGSNLVVTVGTTLSVGQTFTILDKVGAGAITGTFAQGSTVVGSDGTVFSVSYTGGDGNDIVLTVLAPVPESSTWIGGALAVAGLAFTQRRRLRKLIAFSR